MKRPPAFFLVVVWFSILMLMQFSGVSRFARQMSGNYELTSSFWYFLPLIALVGVIWLIRGLVRLQPFYRWFAIVFFLWSTAMGLWRVVAFHALVDVSNRVYVFVAVSMTFNLLCAWYLARRSFRAFAVQYVAERQAEKHTRDMMAAAQKNTLHEISKGKHR